MSGATQTAERLFTLAENFSQPTCAQTTLLMLFQRCRGETLTEHCPGLVAKAADFINCSLKCYYTFLLRQHIAAKAVLLTADVQ